MNIKRKVKIFIQGIFLVSFFITNLNATTYVGNTKSDLAISLELVDNLAEKMKKEMSVYLNDSAIVNSEDYCSVKKVNFVGVQEDIDQMICDLKKEIGIRATKEKYFLRDLKELRRLFLLLDSKGDGSSVITEDDWSHYMAYLKTYKTLKDVKSGKLSRAFCSLGDCIRRPANKVMDNFLIWTFSEVGKGFLYTSLLGLYFAISRGDYRAFLTPFKFLWNLIIPKPLDRTQKIPCPIALEEFLWRRIKKKN